MALDDVFGDAIGAIRQYYAGEADREDVQKLMLLMEAMDAVLMGECTFVFGTPTDEQWKIHHAALSTAIKELEVTPIRESLDLLRRRIKEIGGGADDGVTNASGE